MERIGLVSCTKLKRECVSIARDLYDVSPYFRAMMGMVDVSCDHWFVLSAKHGVLKQTDVVAPYDETLVGAPANTKRAWALGVCNTLHGMYANPGGVTFEVHAGQDYVKYLRPLLEAEGFTVEEPLAGLKIGERRQWYACRAAERTMVLGARGL